MLIVLFIFIFNNNGIIYLLDSKVYFIYLIFTLILIYFIFLNNYFLNNINYNSVSISSRSNFVPNFKSLNKKNYSTLSNDRSNKTSKKTPKEGYLGYNIVHNFGNVSPVFNIDDSSNIEFYTNQLENNLKIYLKDIPENMTYSVLPVLRWQIIT